jgi:GWxTD domain-containing protein
MIVSMKRAAILLLLAAAAAEGQIPPGPPSPMAPRNVFFETVALPSGDSALVRVDVHYRIEREFFISQREMSGGTLGNFQRRGEVLVELIDDAGLSRGRSLTKVEVNEAEGPAQDPDRKQWAQGFLSLEVPPGTYTVSFEVTDLQSQHRFADNRRTITVASPRIDSLTASPFFFILPPAQRPTEADVEMLNYGGDLLFGSPADAYVGLSPVTDTDSSAVVSVRMSVLEHQDREEGDSLVDMTIPLLRNRRLEPAQMPGRNPGYRSTDSVSQTAGLLVPLRAQKLLLRSYELEITVRVGPRTTSLKRPVRVVWPDMPLSLRDVDDALLALRFIVPERILDSLMNGSFQVRRNNLEAFWKSKDQTPETPYNELMIQYYRRVDHAIKAFGTLKQPDGTRTDRGRIYILYGAPTRVERSLDPALGFTETWTYEKTKRSFVFVDRARNGTYVLQSGGT